ncbi:small heat shock protein [Pholiota molesta]|nr:small heat shock protein [Pholiota molesta]
MSNNISYEPCYDFDRLVGGALSDARKSGISNQVKKGDPVDGVVRLFKPRIDLHENMERNMVTATFELPGVSKDDIEIDVHNGRLTIFAETKQKVDGYSGKYSRTIHLPRNIKEEEIKAFWNNGILTIVFPKTSPEPAAQCISIF